MACKAIKPFLSYEEQIQNLTEKKGLIINDIPEAIKALEDISYYALIGGYKNIFYNPMTRKYNTGTTFDDILAIYYFDHALRRLFFSYICLIEEKLRSHISYHFVEAYGEEQETYLTPDNYANTRRNRSDISGLIRILSHIALQDRQHDSVVYQRTTYNNVPLWTTVSILTFGQSSKMYSLLQPSVKAKVSHHFEHVTERELIQHIRFLTDMRNVCAHNERLFSHTDRYEIPDTSIHAKLNIPMHGEQYVCGRHDLFATVISLRYLLNKPDFLEFKRQLKHEITKVIRRSHSLTKEVLLSSMGFPTDWERISRLSLK